MVVGGAGEARRPGHPRRIEQGSGTPARPLPVLPLAVKADMFESQKVESRMGAVAWAMRQRSVSHPRSSNRTCRFPASGSPTGFTVRHTTRGTKVGVRGATPRVLH